MCRSFQISGATKFHIGLSNDESVSRFYHDVHPLARVFSEIIFRNKDAITLFRPTSHASAQLVQLSEAKPFGIFHHHHRRIRDIHPDLNHGCGNQDLRFVRRESTHRFFFLSGLHAAVHSSHFPRRKGFANRLVAFLQSQEIQFFIVVYQRIDEINLPSFLQFRANAVKELAALPRAIVPRLNRFASGWQLIDDTHVQITVNRHRQGAGYGRCGHYQHMWRTRVLVPQRRPLLHTETVLFVNHAKPQVVKDHAGFDERMRPDEHLHFARCQSIEHHSSTLSLDIAREQFDSDAQFFELGGDPFVVLFGQNLGRRHDARLKTIVERQQAGERGHHRFARAHIALQQPVHLSATAQVAVDFAHHSFLCFRECKGNVVLVKIFEERSDARKRPSDHFRLPFLIILEYGKL